jgi:hypothetical protein
MPTGERGAEAAPQDHQRHGQRHRQQNPDQDANQDGAVLLGLVSVNVQTPQVRLALSQRLERLTSHFNRVVTPIQIQIFLR